MDLTGERKKHIDSLDHLDLLMRWRFAAVGDPWFQGETGEYWAQRIAQKQKEDPEGHSAASKEIGW